MSGEIDFKNFASKLYDLTFKTKATTVQGKVAVWAGRAVVVGVVTAATLLIIKVSAEALGGSSQLIDIFRNAGKMALVVTILGAGSLGAAYISTDKKDREKVIGDLKKSLEPSTLRKAKAKGKTGIKKINKGAEKAKKTFFNKLKECFGGS